MGGTEQEDDDFLGAVKGLKAENARLSKELEDAKARVESLVLEKFEASGGKEVELLNRRVRALEAENRRLKDVNARLVDALKGEKAKVDLLTEQHQKPLPWQKKKSED